MFNRLLPASKMMDSRFLSNTSRMNSSGEAMKCSGFLEIVTKLQARSLERLAEAIEVVTSDEQMKNKAAALGEKISCEDGIGKAVKIIDKRLRKS